MCRYGTIVVAVFLGMCLLVGRGQDDAQKAGKKVLPDAVQEAQTPRKAAVKRPEQKKSEHDKSDIFKEAEAPASSPAIDKQPEGGRMTGFEFYRDPLGAKKLGMTFEEIMKADVEAKPKVMAALWKPLKRRLPTRCSTASA